MANEVEVYEYPDVRGRPFIRPSPPLAKQTLTIGGAVSSAFNRSTHMVTVITTTACRVEFSSSTGADPAGAGNTIRLVADREYDFSVIAGRKIIAVAL